MKQEKTEPAPKLYERRSFEIWGQKYKDSSGGHCRVVKWLGDRQED
ncbi:MAG: hypothetical protein IJX71_04785 [Oscillospiraceae bacterium]|nr:hypothetical protein [Oscillospiraceae bacterium]